MAKSGYRSSRREGHGVYSPNEQYYETHWEDDEDGGDDDGVVAEDVNRLRTAVEPNHLADHSDHHHHHGYNRNEQQQKQRGFNDDVVNVGSSGRDRNNIVFSPRQKFSVEFDYEDNIETTSSGSFSSGYGRPSHHHHHRPVQSHQEPQVRYFVDGNQSGNRPTMNKGAYGTRNSEIPEKFRDEKDGSEIYVVDTAYMKPPASVYSHYSGKAPSEMSSVKTKTSRKGGVVVETMAAPNPCCPNTKGVCWLLVLVNLGLILVTLGFSIVLQLFNPPFVWYFGIAFLIVGFIALIASLIFCLHFCRESEEARRRGLQPGEMYWTHHWQKRIALPGMTRHETEKVADDVSTVYSARHDPDDKYYSRDDRRDMTPIHTYSHNQRK